MTRLKFAGGTLASIGVALVFFLMLESPIALATNGQSPNRQITNSNTSQDFTTWIRLSMTTATPFHFTSGTNEYTLQLNGLTNGGSTGCYCGYTWWYQAVVEVKNSNGGTKGAWVTDGVSEIWNGFNGPLFCQVNTSPVPNINNTGYFVQSETFVKSTTTISYSITIVNNVGTVLFSKTQTCSYPNGTGPINYFNQVEGAIVGGPNLDHATFKPLNTNIFYGYIDLISAHNQMSTTVTGTQTGETSNLYQVVTSYYSESYGTGYLYTVQSNENTEGTTAPILVTHPPENSTSPA
jgi:hypothetical protein